MSSAYSVISTISGRQGSRVSTPAGSITGSVAGVSSDTEARQAEQIHHLMMAARKWRQKYENTYLELKAAAKERRDMEKDFLRKQLKMQEEYIKHEKESLKAQSSKYEGQIAKLKDVIDGLRKSLWPKKKLEELTFQVDYERAMRKKETNNYTKDKQKLEEELKDKGEHNQALMDKRKRRVYQLWRLSALVATLKERCRAAEEKEDGQNRKVKSRLEKQTKRYEAMWNIERERAVHLRDTFISDVEEKVLANTKMEAMKQSFDTELRALKKQMQMDDMKLKAEMAWREMDMVALQQKGHQENVSVLQEIEQQVDDLKKQFCMVSEQIRSVHQTVTYMDEKLYPVHLIVKKLDKEKVISNVDLVKSNFTRTARNIVSRQRKELSETLKNVERCLASCKSPRSHQALLENLTHLQVLVDLNSRDLAELRRILKCRKTRRFYDRSKDSSSIQAGRFHDQPLSSKQIKHKTFPKLPPVTATRIFGDLN